MIQSLDQLHRVDPGFNPDNVMTLQFNLPGRRDAGGETIAQYQTPESRSAFMDQLIERVQALPGVTHAGAGSRLPLTGGESTLIYAIDGRIPQDVQNWPNAQIRWVTPEFFETLQIPLARGRGFTAEDRTPAPRVIIVNEALARRAFPDEEAVGKRLFVGNPNGPPWEIVGIVRDTQESDLRETRRGLIYLPYLHDPTTSIHLAVRTEGDAAGLANALRREISLLDRDIAVFDVRTMEEVVDLSLAQARFAATLLGAFAAVALGIAVVGVYGVMSHAVNQRRNEFGIRMALGAERGEVLRMVLRQAVVLAAVGAAAGTAGALVMTRRLSEMLFVVSPADPATLGGVALALVVVAIGASLVPAWRAVHVDPLEALRPED
jgi:putative ABC transport system permease protein